MQTVCLYTLGIISDKGMEKLGYRRQGAEEKNVNEKNKESIEPRKKSVV